MDFATWTSKMHKYFSKGGKSFPSLLHQASHTWHSPPRKSKLFSFDLVLWQNKSLQGYILMSYTGHSALPIVIPSFPHRSQQVPHPPVSLRQQRWERQRWGLLMKIMAQREKHQPVKICLFVSLRFSSFILILHKKVPKPSKTHLVTWKWTDELPMGPLLIPINLFFLDGVHLEQNSVCY